MQLLAQRSLRSLRSLTHSLTHSLTRPLAHSPSFFSYSVAALADFGKVQTTSKLGEAKQGTRITCDGQKCTKGDKCEGAKTVQGLSYTYLPSTDTDRNCPIPKSAFVKKNDGDVYECDVYRREIRPPEFAIQGQTVTCGGEETASWDLHGFPRVVRCKIE